MEEWQRVSIIKNLPALISCTDTNSVLLTALQQNGILRSEDVEKILGEGTQMQKAQQLYSILLTRHNSYHRIVEALYLAGQFQVADIFLEILSNRFSSLQIEWLGNVRAAKSLFDADQIQTITLWLEKNLASDPFDHFSETYLNKNKVIKLLKDTIPQCHTPYVSRHLSRRLELNPEVFKTPGRDTFVFKNIQRSQIIKFVNFHEIESSTSQLFKREVSTQFINLDCDSDWPKICDKVKNPVHLIRYDKTTDTFLLETTSGGSSVLQKYLKYKNDFKGSFVSEDEFIQITLKKGSKNICIADMPGIGKSCVLASLAAKVSQTFPDRLVAFIRLYDILTEPECSNTRTTILKHISTSSLATHILDILTEDGKVPFVLFFDGLDELTEVYVEQAFKFLKNVVQKIPEARVYVTSNSEQRVMLEDTLGVASYDIKPFDSATYSKIISDDWSKSVDCNKYKKLEQCADFCMRNLNHSLQKHEKAICGAPLRCLMLGDVYADKVLEYVHQADDNAWRFLTNLSDSLLQLYIKFMETKLGNTKCKFFCMQTNDLSITKCDRICQVKSFHTFNAAKLIFPSLATPLSKFTKHFENLTTEEICLPGIILQTDVISSTKVHFIHRSFAEYLAAEYIVNAILTSTSNSWASYHECVEQIAFNEVFTPNYSSTFPENSFRENNVAYFVNALLFASPMNQLGLHTAHLSSSSNEFLSSLVACLRFDYHALQEILIKVTRNSPDHLTAYHKSFLHKFEDIAVSIFEVATTFCKLETVQRLCRLFREYFDIDLISLCSKKPTYMTPVQAAIRKGNVQLVEHLVDRVPLENNRLLCCCLEDTFSDSDVLIKSKLKIAHLLLTKCQALVKEPWSNNPIIDIHPIAIKFLLDRGVDLPKSSNGFEIILQSAAKHMTDKAYMALSEFHVNFSTRDLFLEPISWIPIIRQISLENTDPTKNNVGILDTILLFFRIKNSTSKSKNYQMDYQNIHQQKLHEIANFFFRTTLYRKYQHGLVTLFYMAVKQGILEVVEWLLSFNNSYLEMRFSNDDTCIIVAVKYQQLEMLKFLIFKGANVLAVTNTNETILHVAATTTDNQFFHKLLTYLEENADYLTSMIDKSKEDNKQIPNHLYQLFSWKEDTHSQTPLHFAIKYLDLPEKTLDLFLACVRTSKRSDIAETTFDINAVDRQEKTALHLALEEKRSFKLFMHLIIRGSKLSVKNEFGCNAAHICAQSCLVEHLDYLVQLRCDVNEVDNLGNTALQCAVNYYYDESDAGSVADLSKTIKLLLDSGANVEYKNLQGLTVKDLAIKMRFPYEILKLFENSNYSYKQVLL